MSSVESAAGSGVPVAATRAATKPNYITWTALAMPTATHAAGHGVVHVRPRRQAVPSC